MTDNTKALAAIDGALENMPEINRKTVIDKELIENLAAWALCGHKEITTSLQAAQAMLDGNETRAREILSKIGGEDEK